MNRRSSRQLLPIVGSLRRCILVGLILAAWFMTPAMTSNPAAERGALFSPAEASGQVASAHPVAWHTAGAPTQTEGRPGAAVVHGTMLLEESGEGARLDPDSPTKPGSPGNENWAGGFQPSGTNGKVFAFASDGNGNIYAAGGFKFMGSVRTAGVARWDGTAWHALGIGPTTGTIYAVAADAKGNVYIGGNFASVGSVKTFSIAKWNGYAWGPIGNGMPAKSVNALAVDLQGNLYAGGDFDVVDGITVNGLAMWDGSTWHALGSNAANVYALAFDANGDLYAGGSFVRMGDVSAHNIARWDGSAWHAVGSGVIPGVDRSVRALAFDRNGQLYVGGTFLKAGNLQANGVARWDGAGWHPLGGGVSSNGSPSVASLAIDELGTVFVGGRFNRAGNVNANAIAAWDGAAWHALAQGVSKPSDAVDVSAVIIDSAGKLLAGGWFTIAGDVPAYYVARWDGEAWSSMASGNGIDFTVNALAVDLRHDVYAGGYFWMAGSLITYSLARFDGSGWRSVGGGVMSGLQPGSVKALATDDAGNLYAGGSFTQAGDVNASNIARWDGQRWHSLGTGMNGSVQALALDGKGNLYAGGNFTQAGSVAALRVARWDGDSWHSLGGGVDGEASGVLALVVDDNDGVYAGGFFTSVAGVSADRIAYWDGVEWHPLGSGLNGTVAALTLDSHGNLYAGGESFDMAGGVRVDGVARWNESSWSRVGLGITQRVSALAVDGNDNLYAGGFFGTADTIQANSVARYSGSGWQAMGAGLDNSSSALIAGKDANLYVGGGFSQAGSEASFRIGQWTAADGSAIAGTGNYMLYVDNLPINIHVTDPGDLVHIGIQRFDASHAKSPPPLRTGFYWEIEGTNGSGGHASGYSLDLTLPSTCAPDSSSVLCREISGSWDCGANSHTETTVTRDGVSALGVWTVGDACQLTYLPWLASQ